MASCGSNRIDLLLAEETSPSLVAGDEDREAVAILQDLLICHGFSTLPGPLAAARGVFGPQTTEAVESFQHARGLPSNGSVDAATLGALVKVQAEDPRANRGYLTLVLDLVFGGLTRVMSLTTQFEGAARFRAANPNTDRQGLSFGLIQWAQKPGRLHEILRAFQEDEPALFATVFGTGTAPGALGWLTPTATPSGGVAAAGHSTDPDFELVADPWKTRFHDAALRPALQRVQVRTALAAFTRSLQALHEYAPRVRSERAVAFMLDLANQHGDGGAKSIFESVDDPDLAESALLLAMESASVARVQRQYGNDSNEAKSTKTRRQAFRQNPLLSNDPVDL